MALPPGVQAKTVTIGIASFADGSLANGRVTISLNVNVLHVPSNRPIFSSDMTKPFVDGMASFDLLPTDAPGLNRKDFSYHMKVEVAGANTQPDPIDFLLPTAGPDTVDLDGLVTVPSSAGIPISVEALTADSLDPYTADFIGDPTSATGVALRAAFGSADPVLSNFQYDGSGNLLSYQEDGVTITLTYNPDGTVATQQRGSGPVRAFSYSGGNLAGVA